MAGITLAQAEARLTQYLTAEEAVLSGQAYRLNTGGIDRMVTRADLEFIQKGIDIWNSRAKSLAIADGSAASVGLRVREVNL